MPFKIRRQFSVIQQCIGFTQNQKPLKKSLIYLIISLATSRASTIPQKKSQILTPSEGKTFIPDAQFVQSEIYWGSEMEETTIETTKPQNEFRLYIVANGKGGVVIQRHMSEKHHIRYEQSCELQEKDQIILLQEDYEPQISFIVQHFVIKQL